MLGCLVLRSSSLRGLCETGKVVIVIVYRLCIAVWEVLWGLGGWGD